MRRERDQPGAVLAAGVTTGILTVLAQVSFAVLLFSGPLASHLGLGIATALMGAVAIGGTMALRGSFPGTIGRPHEIPVVVLALLCARVTAEIPEVAPWADPLATVLVLIALASGLFGLLSLLLGWFRAGDLFRYMPYPVLGGFVAGSGALLVRGGVEVMLGVGPTGAPWSLLLQPEMLPRWLPGVLMAVAMVAAARRWTSWLTIPSFLLASVIVFHLLLVWSGQSPEALRQMGLLPDLSDVAFTGAWSALAGAGPVAWELLLRRSPDLLAVSFIALLGTLLNASAIEVTVRQELDLNHDLRVVGLANLLAALVGSPPGFHSLSSSALPERMGARGRGIGLVATAVCAGALIGARGLLGLLPFAITGGLLVFLGLSLLANWLIDKRPHLSALEFVVLLAILLLTVTAGWMTALLFGLILALLLFTVQYSRVSAIRSVLTARSRRSSVDRSPEATRLLDRHGDAILVICLQGHLFFGTAHALRRAIHDRLETSEERRPRWIVLDMRLLSGLDASAIYTFQRLQQICEEASSTLLFSGLSRPVRSLLQRSGILHGEPEGVEWFRDLDHAVEFCENDLLSMQGTPTCGAPEAVLLPLEVGGPEERQARERLMACFTSCSWAPRAVIIEEGAPPSDLYFLLSGRVVVERCTPGGQPLRLRTVEPGTCIGEMSFYLGSPTSASVIAEGPVTALRLSREALKRLERNDPRAALLLHRLVARRLAERVQSTNTLAEALAG